MTDEEQTIVYNLLDADEPPLQRRSSSTPAARRTTREDQSNEFRLMETIDFDGPGSFHSRTERQESRSRGNSGVVFGYKKSPMKPGKFDGTGSLESFLAQFEVCAKHNRWTGSDRVDFLKCALDKAATQLLWDFGAHDDVTYDELVGRLRQRYGTEGQAETFRTQLYYRRQRADETLSTLLHDIRRLVVLAYPVPSNETTEIVARDAFLEAMRDRELSLKVREREPKTLDEAYRTALRLEAYQRTMESDDRRRPMNRVRGAAESDAGSQVQQQLDRFLKAQREEQQKWQQDMEARMERHFEAMRHPTPRDAAAEPDVRRNNGNQRSAVTCYGCGRAGRI